jgi:hypothetical protein
MTMESGWEYAMLARGDGTPVVRTEALRSFEKFQEAIADAGGRAPIGSDGSRQVWNDVRGWHDRTERRDMSSGYASSDLEGDGWTIISTPDDRALEAVAKQIWRIGFRLAWPAGWQVRFADLRGPYYGYAALTKFAPYRLILIDRENYRRRGDEDLETSLHHELAHLACGPKVEHDDARFHATMSELRTRVPRLIPAWRQAG